MIPIVRTVDDLRGAVNAWRREQRTIALVPTMGALHEGHLSLVRLARQSADRVAASLFINPRQFAAHEDLARYPRDERGDCTKLEGAGCDLLYAPGADSIYPPGFSTSVAVAGVSAPLEGETRPHFFGGVATVDLNPDAYDRIRPNEELPAIAQIVLTPSIGRGHGSL